MLVFFFRILLIVIRILIYILSVMNKNKTVVVILEIAKYIISALLGYFGGMLLCDFICFIIYLNYFILSYVCN